MSRSGVLATLALVAGLVSGCTVGQGTGEVRSELLIVPDCWHGPWDLEPSFFAAVPFRDTLQIRIQNGSDLSELSDGVSLLVDHVPEIRQSRLGTPITVGLAPQLVTEIAPGIDPGPPPLVSLALYLRFSCHNQNVTLYALDGTIVFEELFSGDPQETVGAEKLTQAAFDVRVADPRNALPGTLDVPEELTSRLTGSFSFHFQRGQPGQPFP